MAATKLDPKDFIFLKRKNETLVKRPGDVNGQGFVIELCENCDIYLLDHTQQVQIDDCKAVQVDVRLTPRVESARV